MVAAAKLYTVFGNLRFGEDGFPITWVPFFPPPVGIVFQIRVFML